jgi:hypothetical protein
MNDKEVAEVLMAYADDLNRGAVDREKYLERVSGHGDELEALLHLTERLKRTLVPIRPSLTFVNNLARQLAFSGGGEAEYKARGHRREIFIGAAAIGSALSVIGLVAYLIRNRMQVKTQVASAR